MNSNDAHELDDYRRLEQAICPPGMKFAEHINNLQAQLARAQTPLWEDALTAGFRCSGSARDQQADSAEDSLASLREADAGVEASMTRLREGRK